MRVYVLPPVVNSRHVHNVQKNHPFSSLGLQIDPGKMQHSDLVLSLGNGSNNGDTDVLFA